MFNQDEKPHTHRGGQRPNIVFILTDDQDLHMRSLDYMPFVKKHLIERGTSYRKHFCTTALCCPSRVTLWTGKAAHNTNVTDVLPPYGGYPKFIAQGLNHNYLPVWFQEAGYGTYYAGKLFNAHSVDTYNAPFAAGWTGSDFLLDPFTYWYMNSTYQRNRDPPKSYEGRHSVDVLAEKALGFIDEAYGESSRTKGGGKPFFLGIAPVAPHANIWSPAFKHGNHSNLTEVEFSPPVPASRHAHLFSQARVPRTENFNPDRASGGSWIRSLARQGDENVAYNDHFYVQRLRTLQSVDELVDGVVRRLDALGLLDDTYIIYTSDNGYHIGQHRLQPGKQCSFDEDVNIPLVIRGPDVPVNHTTDIVTTHTDMAPTLLGIAGATLRDDFDGLAIPLTALDLEDAKKQRHEHVAVEHWGFASNEGVVYDWYPRLHYNNTYKALRILGEDYNMHYQVWCNNERELYDLISDPGQMINLMHPDEQKRLRHMKDTRQSSSELTVMGLPLEKVVQRLESVLFVLKSCRAESCVDPWRQIHPAGNVASLKEALSPRFDAFYDKRNEKTEFDRCEMGYILDAEGPQFSLPTPLGEDATAWKVRRDWHEWT
ncbi:arylsulfatase-like protein [Xylariaceae sp. FL0594]|nr:arylsulfatase-like protein [Xylariaceae sp. FL0594]